MRMLAYFVLFGMITLSSCSTVRLKQKPIIWNAERDSLSMQYMDAHYGLHPNGPTIVPKMVVLHWTAIPTFEKSFEAFDQVTLPGSRTGIAGAGALNVSVQFLVDRDGTIYQLMPETTMGRHVIGLNHCSIGVENVGGTPETPLTEAQLRANIQLVKYLVKKYPIDYVIGHHEYTLFEGHPLWLEKDTGYRTQKTDPGDEFMNMVRQAILKYDLKPLPQK